jgi:hypothetical protein
LRVFSSCQSYLNLYTINKDDKDDKDDEDDEGDSDDSDDKDDKGPIAKGDLLPKKSAPPVVAPVTGNTSYCVNSIHFSTNLI